MADSFTTEPFGREESQACPCCGRLIHEGGGWLLRGEEEIASYSYRWSEGHEARFKLALVAAQAGEMRPGFVVVSCNCIGQDLHYSVVDPAESPWASSPSLGRLLSREEALDPNGMYPDLWQLTHTIAANEPRLAERILAWHGA